MLSKNQIKQIQLLHQKKYREREKLFIAEGVKLCEELMVAHPTKVKQIFCTARFFDARREALNKSGIALQVCEDFELKKISLLETPNEILIVAAYLDEASDRLDYTKQVALYLDDIRDPGNMGTLIRLADWFGIQHIYASANSCDCYNPKVVQASMGALLRVHIHYHALDEVIQKLNIQRVYGALLNGADVYNEKLAGGLIVIGNEGRGISPENLPFINHAIRIPAAASNGSESLNAAMAGAVIISEFFRQLRP